MVLATSWGRLRASAGLCVRSEEREPLSRSLCLGLSQNTFVTAMGKFDENVGGSGNVPTEKVNVQVDVG